MSVVIDPAPPALPPRNSVGGDDGDGPHPRRWLILAVILIAQLLVVLDATIVNIALPDAQQSLDMSDSSRQWVVTAYALAFGSLLLLGGRIADYAGRKRAFVIGSAGFAAASALGGIAQSQEVLFGARALQVRSSTGSPRRSPRGGAQRRHSASWAPASCCSSRSS